jgi:hypothetical protein
MGSQVTGERTKSTPNIQSATIAAVGQKRDETFVFQILIPPVAAGGTEWILLPLIEQIKGLPWSVLVSKLFKRGVGPRAANPERNVAQRHEEFPGLFSESRLHALTPPLQRLKPVRTPVSVVNEVLRLGWRDYTTKKTGSECFSIEWATDSSWSARL